MFYILPCFLVHSPFPSRGIPWPVLGGLFLRVDAQQLADPRDAIRKLQAWDQGQPQDLVPSSLQPAVIN